MEEIIKKIRSIKLCLSAHPDNEPNSEFADRISDCETPIQLEWFSLQEKKGKFNTWQDDRTTYDEIFATEYPNLFSEVQDYTMCNSGGCTD